MKSVLITPNNKEFKSIKYYDFNMAAKQIVEMYIEKNENNKKEFIEFSKNYNIFEPYLDFLIIRLHYMIKSPFIDDDGLLFSKNDQLCYYSHYDVKEMNPIYYPKADDKSLRISPIDANDISYSILDLNNNLAYKIIRTEGDFHGKTFSILLLHLASKSKKLYDDYVQYIEEDTDELDRNVNKYFRTMLDYVQVVKYEDGSGHLIYNDSYLTDDNREILNTIKNTNKKMSLDKEFVDEKLYDEFLYRRQKINNELRKTI